MLFSCGENKNFAHNYYFFAIFLNIHLYPNLKLILVSANSEYAKGLRVCLRAGKVLESKQRQVYIHTCTISMSACVYMNVCEWRVVFSS